MYSPERYELRNKDFKLSFAVSLQKTHFKACVNAGTYIVKIMRKLSKLGFAGIELSIRDPQKIDISLIKKGLLGSGLKVSAVGTGQAYFEEGLSLSASDKNIRKSAVRRIKSHIDFCSEFKAPVIIGLIRGNMVEEKRKKDSIEIFKDSLTECLKYASAKDIFLVLEPINRYECNFINNIPEAVSFIKELNHSYLRLLIDTFHMNIEDRSLIQSIKKASPWLAHVHIADSNRWYPGCGHLDFKSIFDTLKAVVYKGFVSGEMLPLPDEDKAIKGFLQFMHNYEDRKGTILCTH